MSVARYAFLPGIIPRVKEFAHSGFGWLAYLMAYVYVCVRLLPPNHPYLLPANFGRYGVRHVVAEAANRIQLRRENLDQIVVFCALLVGFGLLIAQFAVLFFAFVVHPALAAPAAPAGFTEFFKTPTPTDDIAFELLDKVFAIPDMYGSKYNAAAGSIPPFNLALQQLIKFYNFAILIVGVAIFLYYMVVVVAETALTGTPFGRRFDHIYAPFRLVVAVGLLVPLNYGLNSAQYIALFAAKYGSSLATNTWLLFNKTTASPGSGTGYANPLGAPDQTLLARPQLPDIADVVEFISLARVCKRGYELEYTNPPYSTSNPTTEKTDIEPYLVGAETPGMTIDDVDWTGAIDPTMFNGRDITIRFGHRSATLYPNLKDNVYPFCGEMTIHTGDVTQTGSTAMQEYYYDLVSTLWYDPELDNFAQRATAIYMVVDKNADGTPKDPSTIVVGSDTSKLLPGESWRQEEVSQYAGPLQDAMRKARDDMAGTATTFNIEAEVQNRGWGGAAIWYNRIAMWNGALFGAVFNTPSASRMPSALDKVERERRLHDENVDSDNRYQPYMQEGRPVGIDEGELDLVRMMSAVVKYWKQNNPASTVGSPVDSYRSTNFFIDLINKMFPLDSLMQIRYNVDINPLAQLVGLGKSIIDSTVRNLTLGLVFAAGGGLMDAMQPGLGAPMAFFSSVAIGLVTLSLTVGFILYYVLPFLPFIYFFFAVGNWVKTIFEAMVGVPLWALAHLRIDGNGLPGERALDGYFLIFEIFIRPVLILFGLLGGMLIFTAMARALHDVFSLVVANVSGYDLSQQQAAAGGPAAPAATDLLLAYQGSALDEFFYTIIYTIILYSLALSSFKMIDQVPGGILRWMGAGIRSFSDDGKDPAQGMLGAIAYGGRQITGQVVGGLQEGARAGGTLAGTAIRGLSGRSRTVTGTGKDT